MNFRYKTITIFIILVAATVWFPQAQAESSHNYNFISRAQWGADESLRLYNKYNPEPKIIKLAPEFYTKYAKELKLKKIISRNKDGEKLTWPLEYPEKVSKIFIHHTGSSKGLNNPAKLVRDIYHSHAIIRGWGDIGYNYLIDHEGNVYEGRYGGESVVGAHAGPKGNKGSIGIALLGNYNEDNVSEKAKQALIALLSEKTKLYAINPDGFSYFRGEYLPNIMGHKSVMHTSCPGKNLANLLPEIRKSVANLNKMTLKDFSFEYIPVLKRITMPADREMQYIVKLMNTGKKTWDKKTKIIVLNDSEIRKSFIIGAFKLNENKVAPGEIGTFKLVIKSKLHGGSYKIELRPVFNGNHISSNTVSIPVNIRDPHFDYKILGISSPKKLLSANEPLMAMVTLKNTGDTKWRNYGTNRISLGSANPTDRKSSFTKSTRMGFLKEHIVNPTQIGHFIFYLKAPSKTGDYSEYFAPVIESVTWLDGKNMKFDFNVI
ncbi:N-acetylmuramoyl-L-alanine amidase [bacterium]|nr:N-acetylmuramoyl-L-alanine amidase [bacterium]